VWFQEVRGTASQAGSSGSGTSIRFAAIHKYFARRGAKEDRATCKGKRFRLEPGFALRARGIERSWRGAGVRRQTGSPGAEPGNGFYAANAPREVMQKTGRGRERGTERARRSFRIALKMQAGSVDSAAGTGCKASPRRRRAKGRIEERASTGKGIAGAHQRFDPQPGKTGGGEQRA
jgi:hypothetical protein